MSYWSTFGRRFRKLQQQYIDMRIHPELQRTIGGEVSTDGFTEQTHALALGYALIGALCGAGDCVRSSYDNPTGCELAGGQTASVGETSISLDAKEYDGPDVLTKRQN